MRKCLNLLARVALAASLGTPAFAQTSPQYQKSTILASAYDVDGEAADTDQVVASATLADSTSYTVAANPDTCRLVDITVTDADSSITAGVLTIVGTDCWGDALTTTFTFAAGGSGVKTLVVSAGGKASAAYYKTVTTVDTGVLTGEGVGDALIVGYSGAPGKIWPMYGRREDTPSGLRRVDIFGEYPVEALVTSGATSVDVVAVSASTTAPFQNVAVGDILIFNLKGEMTWRRVVTRADADTITVNAGIVIPAAGKYFSFKRFYFSGDPIDGWFPVQGFASVSFLYDVDANVATGGVTSSIECKSDGVDNDTAFEVDTDNVASGAVGTLFSNVDLLVSGVYTHCRASVRIGTGDDGDTAAEDVNILVGFIKL